MRKFFKVLLVTVICLCLIMVAAVYVLLTQIDFNRYKESIVKLAYEQTGRQLSIGDIGVKISLNPLIEVKDVTFSNAEWAKEPVMVSAQSVQLGFAIMPLLQKKIEVNEFIIENAKVNLEESADGKFNWEFVKEEEQKVAQIMPAGRFQLIKSAYAADVVAAESSFNLSSLVIKQVLLHNVTVNYTDKTGKTQSYAVAELGLDENSDGNMDFSFNVNDRLYHGKGVLGGFDKLESSAGYPVSGEFGVAGIDVMANVTLFDMMSDLRFSGNVRAKKFLGANSGYNESADVTLNGNLKKIAAEINSVEIAGNKITGTAEADLSAKIPSVQAKLKSDRIDVASFAVKKQAGLPFSLIKEAQATALVPSIVIPYDAFYIVNADVTADIAQLAQGTAVLAQNLKIAAKLNNGVASLNVLQGQIAGGNVQATLTANAADKSAAVDAKVQKLSIPQLLQILNVNSNSFVVLSGGVADFYADIKGQGETATEIVDSLDGRVVMIVDESQAHLGNIGVLKGNVISQLLDTLKIVKENDDLNLRCAVVRADVKNGKASFPNGIAVNADKFTLVADGNINLQDDAISLSIKPFAGKLSDANIAKALSSLVKLTGTLQNPRIGVDSANAIKTIVGVTTAGPAYLGSQMLLENDGSPCYTALEGTGYESRFPKPDNVVSQTSDDVGQIFNDSVGTVKDATKNIFDMLSGSVKNLKRK